MPASADKKKSKHFDSSTFRFIHCDLSLWFKFEFHILSIVFTDIAADAAADMWTNKTFSKFIEFTKCWSERNFQSVRRLNIVSKYSLLLLSIFRFFKMKMKTKHMNSCHGRKDTIIDMHSNRSADRSIVWRLSFYICTPKKLCERICTDYWTLNDSIPSWFFLQRKHLIQKFNAMQIKAKWFSTRLAPCIVWIAHLRCDRCEFRDNNNNYSVAMNIIIKWLVSAPKAQ